MKIRPPVFAIGDDKKEREGKERYHTIYGYISAIWGADPLELISTKIGRVKGAHDIIIKSNFGFNIFRGFRFTEGRNLHCPIDFAGHRYNSAAATAQPVITPKRLKYGLQILRERFQGQSGHTSLQFFRKGAWPGSRDPCMLTTPT